MFQSYLSSWFLLAGKNVCRSVRHAWQDRIDISIRRRGLPSDIWQESNMESIAQLCSFQVIVVFQDDTKTIFFLITLNRCEILKLPQDILAYLEHSLGIAARSWSYPGIFWNFWSIRWESLQGPEVTSGSFGLSIWSLCLGSRSCSRSWGLAGGVVAESRLYYPPPPRYPPIPDHFDHSEVLTKFDRR